MASDSVSVVGGATAPAEAGSTAPPSPAAAAESPNTDAFAEALKVARGASSVPASKAGNPSVQAIARAEQFGLGDGVGAYDVLGRRYARVEGGKHDGMCVNTSGNARNGQIFERVERDGQVFHVYADGAVRVGAPKPDAA